MSKGNPRRRRARRDVGREHGQSFEQSRSPFLQTANDPEADPESVTAGTFAFDDNILSTLFPLPLFPDDDDEGAAAPGHRGPRLEQIILEELGGLLRDEMNDPRLDDVRFTRVELSGDYASARVWFGVRGGADRRRRLSVAAALDHASRWLRTRLAEALDIKRAPSLRFVFDEASGVEEDPCNA